ncbi:MAG: hypothetical protein DRP47_01450 [Candidatus Zixiibacteriota bacterium]|nr:MAG: hypothetical protein DRP47_01450 [candidate division Zixibacteria bacterium]
MICGFNRYVFLVLICTLIPGLTAANNKYDLQESLSSQNSPFSAILFGLDSYSPTVLSQWPVRSALHETTKLTAEIESDAITWSFIFPAGSNSELLSGLNLWIGGIRGDDTLVSTASVFDLTDGVITHYGREFLPAVNPLHLSSSLPINIGIGNAFRSEVVDTFTNYWSSGCLLPVSDYFGRPNMPLYLKVIQKSYTLDHNPFHNIVILDYTITNIGNETITDGYVGISGSSDIGARQTTQPLIGGPDDLCGSWRDLGMIYMIDNDGDPIGTHFQEGYSAVDALGLKVLKMSPPPTDTNFNWWTEEFGPRLRPTPRDPFRDFNTGGIGAPAGDVNKYYILRHREWDYDQIQTALVSANDSAWMHPDQSIANEIARGASTSSLLSLGPFDLEPDSSVRVAFAVFGGDFVHIDPLNKWNLINGDFERFSRHLHFDLFRQTATDLSDTILNPKNPPTGFRVVYLSSDTVVFNWDPRIFPDIIGTNLYLKPVDDSMFIYPNVVPPGIAPETMGNTIVSVPASSNRATVTGLIPGKLYFASVSHVTESGEGLLCPPIVVGYGNHTLDLPEVQPTSEFVFLDEWASSIILSWHKSEHDSVRYYKIYKVPDSLQANHRYRPFFTLDTSLSIHSPVYYGENQGNPFYYYQMEAYDSVPASQTYYVDNHPLPGEQYWITAVAYPGFESPFSMPVETATEVSAIKDFLVILGTTHFSQHYVDKDSLFAYYHRLMEGYSYDLYDWTDSNSNVHNYPIGYHTDWLYLSRYRIIIVEEFTIPAVLTEPTESTYKPLTRILNSGRDLVYFGTPPGNEQLNLISNKTTLKYDSESFESRYFNLDSTLIRPFTIYGTYEAIDSLAGFTAAQPLSDSLPILLFDTTATRTTDFLSNFFQVDNCLPMTPALIPDEKAEVLYLYQSAFPATSELQGFPCGLVNRHPNANAYAFSFHLWAMEETSARELIDYILNHQVADKAHKATSFPSSLHLYQNYPNPFNPSTTISYELVKSSPVTLEIFNILGQKVTTLVDGKRQFGLNETIWYGRNDRGRPVSSGIYFYRLITNNDTQTMKMLLLR